MKPSKINRRGERFASRSGRFALGGRKDRSITGGACMFDVQSGCWYAVTNQAAGVSGANRRSQQGQRHLVEASESLSGRSALTSWLLPLPRGDFSPGPV